MKVKASITLSKAALKAVDRIAGKHGNRSAVIERAVLEYALKHERELRDARDIAIYKRHATEYAELMDDVLALQRAVNEDDP